MISVVIPVYNGENTIVKCIMGVINQTKSELIEEIIVVDDGSTDNTVLFVRKIDDKRIRIISKSNGGVSSARNVGIKECKAEWIALLDSDDVWDEYKIEAQIIRIKEHPEIKFIGCNRNNENVRIGTKVDNDLYALTLKNILLKNWPHTSTALIKKTVFDEVGLFNEDMKYAEDGDMWNRIAIKYPLYYISISYELAGGGKKSYGERGLSSNIRAMHEGNMRNYRILKNNKNISFTYYVFLNIFETIKYIKRMIITNSRRRK